jgi:phytoene desaturase
LPRPWPGDRGSGRQVLLNTEVDEILVPAAAPPACGWPDGGAAADVVVSNADAGHTYDRLLRNHPRKRWTDAG